MSSGQVHDPKEMFRHAEHVYNGYGIVAERYSQLGYAAAVSGDDRILGLFVPMAILSAFATEIYLKCLLVIDTGAVQWGHKLKELFDALPEPTRLEIRGRFDAYATNDKALEIIRSEYNRKTDFDSLLSASNEAFENVRYLYESPFTDDEGCFLRLIMKSLRETIRDRFPAWSF